MKLMMQPILQERFDQLLGFIKNEQFKLTISENVAAARELLDTLLHSGLLTPDEYRAYHAQIRTALLAAGAIQLKRDTDKPSF